MKITKYKNKKTECMKTLRLFMLNVMVLCSVMAFGDYHKWNAPKSLYCRYEGMELREVEFCDTATILHFMTNKMPVDENFVVPQCCLVDYEGKRHRLLSADGMEIGHGQTYMPPVGSRHIALFFEPIKDYQHPFDLMETPTWLRRFMLGITDASIGYPERKKAEVDESSPETWQKGVVTIMGKVDDESMHVAQQGGISCSFRALGDDAQNIPDVRVRDDGTFLLSYVADRPALSALVLNSRYIPYFAYPGDTLYVQVNNLEKVQQGVTWRSQKGYGTHTNLLSACCYHYPDYYKEYVNCYKHLTQQECFSAIDSVSYMWDEVNDYLSMKYHLTSFEARLLKERMRVYFDLIRSKFVFVQEHLYRPKKMELKREDITEEELLKYDGLRRVDVMSPMRYCTDNGSMYDILDNVCGLIPFARIHAFSENERADVLVRWLAMFFHADPSSIGPSHPLRIFARDYQKIK